MAVRLVGGWTTSLLLALVTGYNWIVAFPYPNLNQDGLNLD